MTKNRLPLEQLEERARLLSPLLAVPNPSTGWVKAIRLSLGMTLKQLGQKLSITKQSVQEIETREREGAITLKSLREVARVLDLELVYGFVPKDGSFEMYIDKRAAILAKKIVDHTANTMALEDQANSEERLVKAFEERKAAIIRELPKALWD